MSRAFYIIEKVHEIIITLNFLATIYKHAKNNDAKIKPSSRIVTKIDINWIPHSAAKIQFSGQNLSRLKKREARTKSQTLTSEACTQIKTPWGHWFTAILQINKLPIRIRVLGKIQTFALLRKRGACGWLPNVMRNLFCVWY